MVRIVQGDFWGNYWSYEDIIKRCFSSLFYKKFHNRENKAAENAFNHLVVEFNRLRVFDRFDVTKKTPENVEKGLEQHIFKWTESILYKEYHDRRKRTVRFRRVSSMDDFHRDVYCKKTRETFVDEPDTVDIDQLSEKDKPAALETKNRVEKLYKKYPTIRDIPLVCSEKYETPLDSLEKQDVIKMILDVCQTEKEKNIIGLKMDGIDIEAIADKYDCSKANISAILNKLKDRYKRSRDRLTSA
jgi:RNA polymerase sigma factor (sigma-70 family)